MSRPPEPRFTLIKPVRFAPEEWDKICARAAEFRLSPSTYLREKALGYRLSGRINAKAIAELGRIGNNLNQLTRVANTTGRIDHSQHILGDLLEVIRRLGCCDKFVCSRDQTKMQIGRSRSAIACRTRTNGAGPRPESRLFSDRRSIRSPEKTQARDREYR